MKIFPLDAAMGETLSLVRDPDNRFDRGAIKVLRLDGEQIGFHSFPRLHVVEIQAGSPRRWTEAVNTLAGSRSYSTGSGKNLGSQY